METPQTKATPSTIGILGGTGVAGSAIAAELSRRGHAVRRFSRGGEGAGHLDLADPATHPPAFAGLDLLVDAVNAGGGRERDARALMVDQLGGALASAAAAGVRHVVSLSIVGADRMPMGYYRVKVDQEAMVRASPLAASIVRATQFHELVAQWAAGAARLRPMVLPRGVLQPVDPREVAVVVADAAEAAVPGALHHLAGPRIESVADLGRRWLEAHGERRRVVTLPAVGGMLRAVAEGVLTDPQAPRGTVGFAEWLEQRR